MNRQARLLSLGERDFPPVKPSMDMCWWLLPFNFLAVHSTSYYGKTSYRLQARETLLTVVCMRCMSEYSASTSL